MTSPQEVFSQYNAFIVDLWGVVHDGDTLYNGVQEAIVGLQQAGKQVIFLSNAPRRADKAREKLSQLGIAPESYLDVLTSGEAAYEFLKSTTKWGQKYFFLGPDKDADLLDGLDYIQTQELIDCDFILNVGVYDDFAPIEQLQPMLEAAAAYNKPMICANPDMVVVKKNGDRLNCAGLAAEAFESFGGEVKYFGKPYPEVYELACGKFDDVPIQKICAIGDNLDTDILGGNRAGIATVLVTGGILKDRLHPEGLHLLNEKVLHRLQNEAGAMPDYVISGISTEDTRSVV
jgi:HAD superfamily hydrolase (TIGR01459 family)